MTHVRVRLVLVAVTMAIWLSPGRVAAQTPAPDQADVQALKAELDKTRAEFEAVRQQYDQRLAALEQKLAQLTGTPPQAEAAPIASPPVPPPEPSPLPDAVPSGGGRRPFRRSSTPTSPWSATCWGPRVAIPSRTAPRSS